MTEGRRGSARLLNPLAAPSAAMRPAPPCVAFRALKSRPPRPRHGEATGRGRGHPPPSAWRFWRTPPLGCWVALAGLRRRGTRPPRGGAGRGSLHNIDLGLPAQLQRWPPRPATPRLSEHCSRDMEQSRLAAGPAGRGGGVERGHCNDNRGSNFARRARPARTAAPLGAQARPPGRDVAAMSRLDNNCGQREQSRPEGSRVTQSENAHCSYVVLFGIPEDCPVVDTGPRLLIWPPKA